MNKGPGRTPGDLVLGTHTPSALHTYILKRPYVGPNSCRRELLEVLSKVKFLGCCYSIQLFNRFIRFLKKNSKLIFLILDSI